MKILLPAALGLMIGLTGCGSDPAPAPAKQAKATKAPKPVANHTSLFPDKNKVSTSIVPDHILGINALPGGSLADYEAKGKKYQMFIVDMDTDQDAAFLLLDVKAAMGPDPQYISYMGGYAGTLNDQPLYCFSKRHYLAGVLGLPKDKADPIAIDLAAQLH